MSKTLIIDPGHGGTDPGAIGFGVNEKDWNLKISLYQYNRLKELGANVAITRTTDRTLDSAPRTNLIRGKYDYCLSNHFNAFNGSARGVETIHSIYSNGETAKRLADAIVKASGLPLRRVFKREGRSGDYYFMHRLTGSTETTISEYGFIDNKQDHDYYKNEDNFYKVAEAVVKGWCAILGVKYADPGAKEDTPAASPSPAPSKPSLKTLDEIAEEVINGKWGNGSDRFNRLNKAGYNADQVQSRVNMLLTKPKPKKTIAQMAQEVIDGKHGNGHANRRKSLGISQAEYEKVRAEVNRRAGSRPSSAPRKSISQMATEVIAGKHGIGHGRRRKSLGISQAEYEKVRTEVNRRV